MIFLYINIFLRFSTHLGKTYFFLNSSQSMTQDGTILNPFFFLNSSLNNLQDKKGELITLSLMADNEIFLSNQDEVLFEGFSGLIKSFDFSNLKRKLFF